MQFPLVKFFVALFGLVCSVQFALGAPIIPRDVEAIEARDVYAPPVLKPDSSSTWVIGTTETVVWDVSSPPAQITNKIGRIVLRDVKTELLLLDNPLASGFDILIGSIPVTVPDVAPGLYQAVVFGDSGNWGEPFEIVAA
ncbi:hypothetical protein BKA70DRAFT_1216420 [Coprinopsis sp. MPI-PUGE-AT-0042]|nr:hypothetical protein BKA70DRAFT_1216420 [Coprinopsis sp. MPI-PUGE-AT-0042]